ncbi:FliI/YscN family ATPase [Algimonas porphyrae]|uniref:ATP synthase n=1 Tax=Algimonas porphyrae TaxID=1128113 RepID=A0ABQ5V418_9PROT|nr:FliI/YscN family ATPase [Algimonas porphyrae]GLQ21425.1 ATP synthase [Algimonas porphyrae]
MTRLQEQTLSELSAAFDAPLPRVVTRTGTVLSCAGQTVQVAGLCGQAGIGARMVIDGTRRGDVIADDGQSVTVALYGSSQGLTSGLRAELVPESALRPGPDWLGKVLDYDGRDAFGTHPRPGQDAVDLFASPPPAGHRRTLGGRLTTGYAAIDTFLPLCRGQRMGLFAGSGVGKTSLLGGLAQGSNADVTVIALIGERGREVRSFVEEVVGPDAMRNTVVFAATSDQPPAAKLRAARLAMATAERFRDQGQHVLFLFDSLTRFAQAHREVALSVGETPALRAFPPSTFPALASLCERAGPGADGTGGDITAVFSVLVQGSDMEEPVADTVRGILDGHIILDRAIAESGRYPAIDIGRSISRALPNAASETENALLSSARSLLRSYEDGRLMVQSGLYAAGSDPVLDKAVACHPQFDTFLRQRNIATIDESFAGLQNAIGVTG